LFETLYVFFVIRHANREIRHVGVKRYPTAEWAAQQIVECCAWDRWPPRFLIHDRDSRYGMTFDNRPFEPRCQDGLAALGRTAAVGLQSAVVFPDQVTDVALGCAVFWPANSPRPKC
jgi:hypothetical protein